APFLCQLDREAQLLWSGPMIDLYLGGDKSIFLSRIVAKNEIFSLEILQQLSIGAMPSFLAFSRNRPLALAIAVSGETLCSERSRSGGALEVISQVPCPGGPAYVAFDSNEGHALAASYGSGHTRLYSISGD